MPPAAACAAASAAAIRLAGLVPRGDALGGVGGPPRAIVETITYFFDGAALDVDNIPKPILDALKGVVYFDDS